MDAENSGAFNQLQLTKTRSRGEVWRADDNADAASRRSSARESVMSAGERWSKSRKSTDSSQTATNRNASSTSLTTRGAEVRRWDGTKRTTTPWDDLRKDPELWFEDGDCLVHFYGRGTSRKGPALLLHRDDIEDAGCRSIFSKYSANILVEEEENSSMDDDDYSRRNRRSKDEIYIQAPPLLGRDDANKFHITTRNLFAFLYDRPMVGAHLGEALVLMHERLNQYRPDKERNRDDMVAYIEDQGYTEFRDSPDHAMGIMYYAEKLRDTDLWTESFVHCVGMYDILNTAIEFPTVSRTIGALITRAHLEMTLRLEHAFADLGNFMEDSISSAYPKLPEYALKHLVKFRAFLHTFYVQQHGSWPPASLHAGADYSLVTKSLLRSLYADFRNLYAFLCDHKSEPRPTQAQIETYQAIYGGLCMPSVIAAFDRRFKNTPLPNPLPLLPSSGSSGRVSPMTQATNLASLDLESAKIPSGNAFTRFLRPKQRKSTKALNTLNQLSSASNTNDQSVMESLLVQEYSKFERDSTVRGDEKLDANEARKVRWLLIYALLQTIIGVVVVPQEVAATENVEYPLCVQTGGTPPWRKRPKTKAIYAGAATPQLEALSTATSPAASPYLTPTTRSGAMTPISAIGEVPPVPQLVLSELEKLQRRSFDSGRSTPASVDGSNASVRSGKLQKKKKSGLQSSSASIRSNRSTRSSFSMMMNRSLNMSTSFAETTMNGPQPTARSSAAAPERPMVTKQKSSPAQLEHQMPSTRSHQKRGSIFGRMRSRASSIVVDSEPEPESALHGSLTSPDSPAHSTFSQARNSPADFTPATTEFPQTAPSQEPKPVAEGTPRVVQSHSTRGQSIAMLDTGLEPDRGRALHAPHSPSITPGSSKKVRNFSRGRSGERPKSSGTGAGAAEVPPPVPTLTKPRSGAPSPARSFAELAVYTDSRAPPVIPLNISSDPIELPPSINIANKPNSRPVSPVTTEEFHSPLEEMPEEEQLPLVLPPPPIPFSSKPNSRSNSPVRSPLSQSRQPPQLQTYAQPSPPPAAQTVRSPLSQVQSAPQPAAYQVLPSQPLQPIQPAQHELPQTRNQYSQPMRYEEEYRGRSTIQIDDGRSTPSVHRSQSRSLALQPPPVAQPQPPVPRGRRERPVSQISESSNSAPVQRSGSVSPISEDETPHTSAELLQRKAANGRANGQGHYESHAVTTPDDTAHAAWNNPQQGSFHQALQGNQQQQQQQQYQQQQYQQQQYQQQQYQQQQYQQQQYQQQQYQQQQYQQQQAQQYHAQQRQPQHQPSFGQLNNQQRQPRTSSRESKYRRAAWAELRTGMHNEATGMPIPPPAVRQYGAPIVRDAPTRGYGHYEGGEGHSDEYSEDDQDGGVHGGVASYGYKTGLMG